MYPVSKEYEEQVTTLDRLFKLEIVVKHNTGTLNLTDEDIVIGSFKHTSATQPGGDFTIGGTVASTIEFGIINDIKYENIEFDGALIYPQIGLSTKPPGGHHFRHLELGEYRHRKLGDYTHAQLMGEPQDITDDDFEMVPLGHFIIDEVNRLQTTITIKAIDEMIKLDKPYSESKLNYPATLSQIFSDICTSCNVLQGTINFPNMDYLVQSKPEDQNITFRNVLGWVAELAGSFSRFDRSGRLRLQWYEPTGKEYTGMNRFSFKPYDHKVQITGIMFTDEDEQTYLHGSNKYAIDLTDNMLVQGNLEELFPNILNNIKDTTFYPYESTWQGDPAIDPGDMILQISENGEEYPTLVTKTVYKYRGKSELKGEGSPSKNTNPRGGVDQKIAQVRKQAVKKIDKEVTELEKAQEQATALILQQLGGHVLKRENELLIIDTPDPETAQKVWRWNLNGFGYSNTGINGPYETAITMDGQIVADFITTGILNASLIKAGELTGITIKTESGDNRLEMSEGSFKAYKDGVKRAELDFDSLDFYDLHGKKAGELIGIDFEQAIIERALNVRSNVAVEITAEESIRDRAHIDVHAIRDYSSILLAAFKDTSYSNIFMLPNHIWIDVGDNLNLDDSKLDITSSDITIESPNVYIGKTIKALPTQSNVRIENGIKIPPSTTAFFGISEGRHALIHMDTNGMVFNNRAGTDVLDYDPSSAKWRFFRGVYIDKDLTVIGSKNSLQRTENYGERLINAYETAEYYFGDIGSGVINEDGECIVYIDDIFQECINTNIQYHVFTQAYNGKIDEIVKETNYFIVYGEPNTEFSWELKAKRKGYEHHRLEQLDRFNHDEFLNLDEDLTHNDNKELNIVFDDVLSNQDNNSSLEHELMFDLSEYLLEG